MSMNQSEETKSAEAVLLDKAHSTVRLKILGEHDNIILAMHEYANQFKSEWASVDTPAG